MPDYKWMITSDPSQPTPDHFVYLIDDDAGALAEFNAKAEEFACQLYLWKLHSTAEVVVDVTVEPEGA